MEFDFVVYMNRKNLAASLLRDISVPPEAQRLVQAAVEFYACGRHSATEAVLSSFRAAPGVKGMALLVDPGTMAAVKQPLDEQLVLDQLLRIVAVAGLLSGSHDLRTSLP
jgi:hypothetical protein